MAVEWLIDKVSTPQMRARRLEKKKKREEDAALYSRYTDIMSRFSHWLISSRWGGKGGPSMMGEGAMEKNGEQYDVYFDVDNNVFSPEFKNEIRVFTYKEDGAHYWQYRYAENSNLPSYLLYEKREYDRKSKKWKRKEWGEYFAFGGWTFAKDLTDKPTVDVFSRFEELTKDLKPFREVQMHFPIQIPPLMTKQSRAYPRQLA